MPCKSLKRSTNESVSLARTRLAKELKNLDADVFLADCPQMPDCHGVDDVLGKIKRESGVDTACEFLFLLKKANKFKFCYPSFWLI